MESQTRFDALPRRLFLDSSTLQTLLDFGETIFEGESPPRGSRAHTIPGFLDDLEALRLIFRVNERAMFDFDQLLGRIKLEKRMPREMDVKDQNNATVANAHATLALFHQREAEKEAGPSASS